MVLSLGHHSVDDLSASIAAIGVDVHSIGDCVVARTAEEAVYEGLQTGWMI